jgi:hypothetical protein
MAVDLVAVWIHRINSAAKSISVKCVEDPSPELRVLTRRADNGNRRRLEHRSHGRHGCGSIALIDRTDTISRWCDAERPPCRRRTWIAPQNPSRGTRRSSRDCRTASSPETSGPPDRPRSPPIAAPRPSPTDFRQYAIDQGPDSRQRQADHGPDGQIVRLAREQRICTSLRHADHIRPGPDPLDHSRIVDCWPADDRATKAVADHRIAGRTRYLRVLLRDVPRCAREGRRPDGGRAGDETARFDATRASEGRNVSAHGSRRLRDRRRTARAGARLGRHAGLGADLPLARSVGRPHQGANRQSRRVSGVHPGEVRRSL